ncbi:MAG: hypothetical protein OQJ97_08180 [Rhodospirillales bacterium]|nr:hypothetical protein [Rhodospirillales bacterium]
MSLQERYKYFPQMAVYDSLIPQWVPFLMFFHQPNFTSEILNTDSKGFRFAGVDGKQKLDELSGSTTANVFTGGSAAFGVGATNDNMTIPAMLSEKQGVPWMNFGGRAHVSTQEWISFSYNRDFVDKIHNIVIFSGVNDLYLYFASKYFNKKMGSFFFASKYFENMSRDDRAVNLYIRPAINKMLKLVYGDFNFKRLSIANSIKLLCRMITIEQAGLNDHQEGVIIEHLDQPSDVIDVLRRNICNWKVFADYYDAKLIYILQPYASWLNIRNLTPNEKAVFEILDCEQAAHWKPLSAKIDASYGWFSGELSRICMGEGVKFYDSNPVVDSEKHMDDMFVDRIHLTDFGNQVISDFIASKI